MKYIIGLALLFTVACGPAREVTTGSVATNVGSISPTRHDRFKQVATYITTKVDLQHKVDVISKEFTNSKGEVSVGGKPEALIVPEAKSAYLYDAVDVESVDKVLARLREILSTENEAYLFIDSPGGSVFAGARLVSYIKDSIKPIHTVAVGMAASMGFHIFEAGSTRYMTSNAFLMSHPASGGTQGTVYEMESLLRFIRIYTEAWDRSIAARADIPYEKFELMTLKNAWLPASEAMELHLADKIVHVP